MILYVFKFCLLFPLILCVLLYVYIDKDINHITTVPGTTTVRNREKMITAMGTVSDIVTNTMRNGTITVQCAVVLVIMIHHYDS